MRFTLYTDKTTPQCVSALNERLHQPATSSRPALDGVTEKSGRFSLALTAPVVGKFTRTTRLDAQLERESGLTVIRGSVPDGAGPQGQVLVLIGLALVALVILIQGQLVLAIFTLLAGGVVLIPLKGDFENGDRLLIEVEKTLKASPKPPKPAPAGTTRAVTTKTAVRATGVKPSAIKTGTTKATPGKPAAKPAARPTGKPGASALGSAKSGVKPGAKPGTKAPAKPAARPASATPSTAKKPATTTSSRGR